MTQIPNAVNSANVTSASNAMNASEKKAIVGLGGIFALRMLGLFMIVPVFSVYGSQYAHATPLLIGLAIGMYGLGQAIFQIPMSLLADKLPRKPIIIAGLLVFALGGVICALSTDIYMVIFGRFIAGSGAVSAVVMALLADVTREQHRTKAMAAMGLTIAMSVMVAFGVGRFTHPYFGYFGAVLGHRGVGVASNWLACHRTHAHPCAKT